MSYVSILDFALSGMFMKISKQGQSVNHFETGCFIFYFKTVRCKIWYISCIHFTTTLLRFFYRSNIREERGVGKIIKFYLRCVDIVLYRSRDRCTTFRNLLIKLIRIPSEKQLSSITC